jgi:hypothetical protein
MRFIPSSRRFRARRRHIAFAALVLLFLLALFTGSPPLLLLSALMAIVVAPV